MSLARHLSDQNETKASHELVEYVSFYLADQFVGVPVLEVQEVLLPQRITPMPHSPKCVIGLLNLRGQIVTAIDLRSLLGMPARTNPEDYMNVIVREGNELFSLMVDSVGDVLALDKSSLASSPSTLSQRWKSCSQGVHKVEKEILVILDSEKIIDSLSRGEEQ